MRDRNGSGWEERWGETGRRRVRGDYNQDILYEKIYVQYEEKIKKHI